MKMKFKRDTIFVLLANKIFIFQNIKLSYNNISVTKKIYTFIYISKTLSNFGLLTSLNKTLGY